MFKVLVFLGVCAGAFAQNTTTVVDVLTSLRESILLDLVQAAGLADALKTSGPFTVFAPNNLALAALGQSTLTSLKSNPSALADILKYHVVSGRYMAKDLAVNEKQLTTLATTNLRVNYYLYKKAVVVEGKRVMSPDHEAGNGVVHIISGVMTPPNGTFIDILSADPNFSTLKAAVETAGLAAALNEGPYTLFAPTNAAFAKLGDALIQKLLANPSVLSEILLYHVVHGTLYSAGMHSASLHTLEDVDRERLYSSFTGRTVSVDGVRVTKKDVSATNGVIHVIDSVLVPASVKPQLANL